MEAVTNKKPVSNGKIMFDSGHRFIITKKFDDGTFNAEDANGNSIVVYSKPDQLSISENRSTDNFDKV